MADTDDFQNELDSVFTFANEKRLSAIVMKAGDLHRLVGGYPGTDHRMPICCSVMRNNMRSGDEVLYEPPRGAGPKLTIKYVFPRN